MLEKMEALLTHPLTVRLTARLRCHAAAGVAEADGVSYRTYVMDAGEEGAYTLPVVAYGERPDGSAVLVCADRHVIKPEIQVALGEFEPATHWTCHYEHSCGAILFTRTADCLRYLIIQNINGHIGFPKGHIEEGETETAAVVRELREEVGVTDFVYIEGYREQGHVITGEGRHKDVTYFLAEFNPTNGLRRQEEEVSALWLLDYDEAHDRLTRDVDRTFLENADRLLAGIC